MRNRRLQTSACTGLRALRAGGMVRRSSAAGGEFRSCRGGDRLAPGGDAHGRGRR